MTFFFSKNQKKKKKIFIQKLDFHWRFLFMQTTFPLFSLCCHLSPTKEFFLFIMLASPDRNGFIQSFILKFHFCFDFLPFPEKKEKNMIFVVLVQVFR